MESSPNLTLLPTDHKYIGTPTATPLVFEMGVYFFEGLQATQQQPLRCVYCEQPFGDRRALNEHYLSAHTQAFSEEELKSVNLDPHV